MKTLSFLSLLFITLNSYAESIINSTYNSIDLAYTSSSGDFTSSATEATVNFKPRNHNFALSYSIADTDFDEVDFGLQGYDITSENKNFKLSYVFDFGDSHLTPFISTGKYNNDVLDSLLGEEVLSYGLLDADTKSFGFLARILIGEKSILNLSLEHIKIDYPKLIVIPQLLELQLISIMEYIAVGNNPLNLNDSELDALKSALEDEVSILGVSYEYHFNDNASYAVGLSADINRDIITTKLAVNYKF
jgi:hypothetical protein